ncbi:MAG TPA: terminase [candidate division Zixibacteria bacterium]|nr:terminase [candidate division Zixibacteria bacterium]HEQ98828.1 terminase [candidate division Zixibacteria bacterium]
MKKCLILTAIFMILGAAMADQREVIRYSPQPGPQEEFLKTPADIAIYGGAAGGGKTWALLYEALRWVEVSNYGAVIFRREYTQIRAEGGLWDESLSMYPHWRGVAREGYLDWRFPARSKIRFAHMQHENDKHNWDGSQITLIGFDQAESFSWSQIAYMFSRNRSTCRVSPYMRMTCNPDPDCWLREFLRWWIDDDTGFAIEKRSGKIRYMVNVSNEIHWGDSPEELKKKFGSDCDPKSCTFIPSSVYDNKILLKRNPGYIANLQALQKVDRERLLRGNWNIRETAGNFFQRPWFEIVNAAPALEEEIRYWDRAATETKPGQEKKASWTAGVRIGRDSRGIFYVTDICRFQGSPMKVEETIKNVASQDGHKVKVGIEQDPGQAGKAEALGYARLLAGYSVVLNPVREAKGIRARPLSAQAEAGNIKLVRAGWNDAYLNELENFDGSEGCVSDQTDASSGAFHLLTNIKQAGVWGR